MVSLDNKYEKPVRLAVIGGSGFYELHGFTPVARLSPVTPWGHPSSPITIAHSSSGFPVAFLARHGTGHTYSPSEVPNQANIAALKHIGVQAILAFSAVGSLREEIKPEDFVIPDQIIDRTKGIRPSTFFGNGLVGHASFGDPFDQELISICSTHASVLINAKLHVPTPDCPLTLICMEGPQFSTRAESNLYRSWGGSVINMSALPESKLAREAEIAYAMICMSTDYDSWKQNEEPVTVEAVMGHVRHNTANAAHLAEALVLALEEPLERGTIGKDLRGSMKFVAMTAPHLRKKEILEKLEYILPGYYS